MAKKKDDQLKKQLKIHVGAAEHHRIRLAATLLDVTMAEFCRDVVIAEAERLTKDIVLPKKPKGKTR